MDTFATTLTDSMQITAIVYLTVKRGDDKKKRETNTRNVHCSFVSSPHRSSIRKGEQRDLPFLRILSLSLFVLRETATCRPTSDAEKRLAVG
jgi:hypothetical protein